jgi:tRNA pseudouridine55 synthase
MVLGKEDKAAIHRGNIDYLGGVTFLINKPLEWTSFDVVKKLRNAIKKRLGVKKIKVGHAGTLDPLATGLLIICVGKHTKKIREYQELPKTYSGTIKLGAVTKSYDRETEEEEIKSVDHLKREEIVAASQEFMGEILQKPPLYSALKREGQRLYKIARRGETVTLPPRAVIIYEFELTAIDLPELTFRVKCSKGTYIRSLAYDLGQKLGVGGYLTSLSRDAIGEYEKEKAFSIDELVDEIRDNKE